MASDRNARKKAADFINAKSIFQEREFPPSDQCEFYHLALELGISELIKKRGKCNDKLVKLFYIQSRLEERLMFTYRKCSFALTADRIREYWQLPTVPECMFQYYRNNLLEVNWEELLQTLAVEGATWSERGRRQAYLDRAQMNDEARIWLHFTCHNVMPISHVSDATRERALLMYLLMTKKPVDLALIAEEYILKCATSSSARANLIFPHLISDLLIQSGVPPKADDDWYDGIQSHVYTSGRASKQAAERRAKKKSKRVASEEEEEDEEEQFVTNAPPLSRRLDTFDYQLRQMLLGQNRLLAAEARRQKYFDPMVLDIARQMQISSIHKDIDSAFLPDAPGYFGPFESTGQSSSTPGNTEIEEEEEEEQQDVEED